MRSVGMVDAKTLKTQTGQMLEQRDLRRAASAYELIHAAHTVLEMLPIPVLEGLRDYAEERIKERKGKPLTCERHYMDCLDEVIRGVSAEEVHLVKAITGIIPAAE
jgi:hypothetical protein